MSATPLPFEIEPIEAFEDVDRERFEQEIAPTCRPAVLRGLVRNWPAVERSGESASSLLAYVQQFYTDLPFQAFFGPVGGRFCYNDTLDGFNYEERTVKLDQIVERLLENEGNEDAPSFYAGSVTAARHLPGFADENRVPFLDAAVDPRIWIGNRTRVAPHYDIPRNIACVVRGDRRFTVFPIEQVKNLYVGPLDFTPAGQSLSLVDFLDPDFERFPKYREALAAARTAVLEPGDAIYIPSLWWHQVEGLDTINLMVNFWWKDTPAFLDSPFNSLMHCLLTIRDLPEAERKAWKALFDFYIFQTQGDPMEHLPMERRGIFAELTPENARRLRAHLINTLNR